MGFLIAKMHDAGVAHGDLTSSNFMFQDGTNAVDSLVRASLV